MRRKVMLHDGYKPGDLVDVRVPSRTLTEREAEELAIRLNRNQGDWDFDMLANSFDMDTLEEWGFEEDELLGVDISKEHLAEERAEIRPREMFRVLISVPLDSAIDIREAIEAMREIDGIEILYGAN